MASTIVKAGDCTGPEACAGRPRAESSGTIKPESLFGYESVSGAQPRRQCADLMVKRMAQQSLASGCGNVAAISGMAQRQKLAWHPGKTGIII